MASFVDRIIIPTIPEFSLTSDEVEAALDMPIEEIFRCCEIVIQPDAPLTDEEQSRRKRGRKPKLANRILVSGIKQWERNGDIPVASLAKLLLLHYFMGRLNNGQALRNAEVESGSDEGLPANYLVKIEGEEFNFGADDIDLNEDLGDYSFGNLS